MFSIDGLVSGLDTSAIIDGLLSIQQTQLDRIGAQKQQVLIRQTAFEGIEANVVALQAAADQLNSVANDVFSVFEATSSDETVLKVAADGNAAAGNYQVSVMQLAAAEQRASQTLGSAETLLTEGTIEFKVGDREALVISINSDNNTLQGVSESINAANGDLSATIINDGSGARLLLTSSETGAENAVTITNNTAASSGSQTQLDLSGPAVQEASDAVINLGSGVGAISISRGTNIFDDVIEGVTLDLQKAEPTDSITVSVSRDTKPAKEAIEGFVSSFNTVMDYIDEQTAYNGETEEAGLLLGDSATNSIRDQLRNTLSRTLANLDTDANRLSSVGITFDEKSRLTIDSGKLDKALSGNLEGVNLKDVRRIFSLDGQSSSPYVSFIYGTKDTATSTDPWEVNITQAAEKASIVADSTIGSSTVIDSKSQRFTIEVDGVESEPLYLTQGTYTQEELAKHMQSVINRSTDLAARDVSVTVQNNALRIESSVYGARSEVGSVSGEAAAMLGFSGTEFERGKDVAGYFLVDGETESATGKGQTLSGKADNTSTAGLQLNISLSSSQITGTYQSDLTVSRGFAAELSGFISELLDEENGRFANSIQSYEDQLEGIEASEERLNSVFESKQQQLISQFVGIESSISNLQNTSAFLTSQLGNASLLAR
ncbi:MAG: flagellar filament capping protein FliD [Pirellulaceae bacterium]|nr:flagellar filament capping protein FliD [Pirellulaceae bacterium]MDG2103860.1 flagellar filament capping protein FliD [Pirellulaceae bacterium]